MPYTPYKTATQWQTYFGGQAPDQIKIAVDTLGALENASALPSSTTANFFFAATGTGTYVSASLVGKTIVTLYVDGVLQTPTVDFTFTTGTGTINWINVPAAAANCWVQYYTT